MSPPRPFGGLPARFAGGALAALVSLLPASCGGESGPDSGPDRALRALELEPLGASGSSAAERAADLVLHVEGAALQPSRAPGDSGAPPVVTLPGPFPEPTRGEMFDRLVLRVRCPAAQSVRVGVLREGMRDLLPAAVQLSGSPDVRELTFDLEQPVDRTRPGKAITIAFAGEGQVEPGELVSVDLQRRSPLSFLPDGGAPDWFDIEGDLRRAVAVDRRTGWRATFEADADEALLLNLGIPPRAVLPGSAPVLALSLEGPGGSQRHEIPVATGPRAPWSQERIPLAEVAGPGGGPIEARFELLAASGTLEDPAGERPGPGFALVQPCVVRASEAPPTVLLVTSDTHRADHVSASGSGVRVQTPALDRLAERGVFFENCTSAANVTNPSHVAIFTATAPRDTGVVDNSSPVSELAPTLAEAFAAAGYATFAAVSASQLAPRHSGLGQGFARFAAPQPGEGDAFDAIAHLERWLPEAEGQPLFVWLHLFDAHAPYTPPAEYEERFWGGRDPWDPDLPEPAVVLPHWARGVRDLDYVEAMYRAEISSLDARLAPVFETPRFRQGVIAFTADHGEHLGQHDVWFDHRLIYPGTLRVPLILAWPGAPPGRRSGALVQNMHLAHTLLELAGLDGSPFPGRNLAQVGLEERPADEPRFAFATYGWSASIESGGWFLVLHLVDQMDQPMGLRRRRHQVELYDLSDDPGCGRDLVHFEPGLARDLRARLIDYLDAARSEGWNVPSEAREAAFAEELAALGYADDAREESDIDWFDADCACVECARFSPR